MAPHRAAQDADGRRLGRHEAGGRREGACFCVSSETPWCCASGEGAVWRGSVGRVAARGKPWPDRRCSSVSRVAPSGTPWADRPASTVSRVAPPWHAQAALTCLFVELVGDSRTLGRPPRQQCKQSSAPVGRPGGTYLSLCGTCRVLVGNLYVFLWNLLGNL